MARGRKVSQCGRGSKPPLLCWLAVKRWSPTALCLACFVLFGLAQARAQAKPPATPPSKPSAKSTEAAAAVPELVFRAKAEDFGKAPPVWCGIVATRQWVRFAQVEVLRGTWERASILVHCHVIAKAKWSRKDGEVGARPELLRGHLPGLSEPHARQQHGTVLLARAGRRAGRQARGCALARDFGGRPRGCLDG
jgi:hypothetical protein